MTRKTMLSLGIGGVAITLAGCLGLLLLYSFVWCDTDVSQVEESIDGRYVASVKREECGLVTSEPGHTWVILEESSRFGFLPDWPKGEAVFTTLLGPDSVSIEWESPTLLIITYTANDDTYVVSQHDSWQAVSIRIERNAPIGDDRSPDRGHSISKGCLNRGKLS